MICAFHQLNTHASGSDGQITIRLQPAFSILKKIDMYLKLKKLYLYSIKLSGIILILLLVLSLCAPYINPYYFWPAALAGLAFPILWAATFVNALLLIKHRFWLLLMLVPMIAGLPMMLRHYNLPLKKSETGSKNEYTIISYNVHVFSGSGNGKSNY